MTNQLEKKLHNLEEIIEYTDKVNLNKQLKLIQQIAQIGEEGQKALLSILIKRKTDANTDLQYLDGILFEILNVTKIDIIHSQFKKYFKNGLIDLKHPLNIDYQPLQELLISQKFQEADKLTQIQLCKLAGLKNNGPRKWLYFTDIAYLPSQDLEIIDQLWYIYSRGKFGFSIQRQIWLNNNRNWEQLWDKIGWKKQGIACRYPNEFIWNINAPQGHLPLFNQLRGVQVLSALFKHMAWNYKVK